MASNRVLKQKGHLNLTEKLKKIDPTGDVNSAKKNINTLRQNKLMNEDWRSWLTEYES